MSKIALGTWAWGAGAFGGDAVFGSKTDVENLRPVFDAAMKAGLNLWDTATVYGMGESEKILGTFVAGVKREDVEVSTKFTPQLAEMFEIGIAWAIAKGTLPIIGATKERHVIEAAEAAKIQLTAEEVARLEALADATGIDTRGGWEHSME